MKWHTVTLTAWQWYRKTKDKQGKLVIPYLYDGVNWFSEGLCGVFKEGKAGVIDKQGNEVIAFGIYEEVMDFNNGLAYACKDGHGGYVDKSGNEAIPFIYDCKGSGLFKEDLICISKGNKWGVLDRDGREVIPFIYDDMAVEFSEGLLAVGKEGKYGCIDRQGDTIIPFIYDDLRNFSQERAAARMGNV